MIAVLSERHVATLFPAYIAVRADLTIHSAGPELLRRAPWITLGASLLQDFRSDAVSTPEDLSRLAEIQCQFSLSGRANQILLGGTVVRIEDGYLLALSFAPSRSKLGQDGATIADYLPGDPMLDALLLAGIHQGLIEDAQEMADELLLERSRVKSVNRRMRTSAGLLAHDFNNHFSIIALNGQRLIRRGGLDQRQIDCANAILESAAKCNELAIGLMTLAGQRTDSPLPLALDPTLLSSEAMFRSLCAGNVTLKLELDSGLSEINVARNGLISSIANLIINARTAMPGGGEVRLITTLDCHDAEARALRSTGSEVVMIAVADNGPGMSNAVQRRVFEKFFTTNDAGIGMGLPFVNDFVTQMRGQIRIVSAVNEGTEVRLYLPLLDSGRSKAEPASFAKQRPRVLLVDDEHLAVDGLTELLEEEGYIVQAAQSAEAAMRIAQETPPDLLLTDIVMKGSDGIKLATWIERRLPGMPIILMSGYVPDQSSLASDWRFLRKPLDPALLFEMLQAALHSRKRDGRP